MKKLLIYVISVYQKYFSPDTGVFSTGRRTCRFEPTCSAYMKESIEKLGIIHGGTKGLMRICKCHPWHSGGYDPVEKEI